MRVVLSLTVAGLLGIATSAAWAENKTSQLVGDPHPIDGRPRASFLIQGPLEPLPAPDTISEHAAPKIFFMNKGGGTYVPGTNDARTNRSTIVSQTSQIQPWNVTAAGWSSVMGCMTTMFSRWNVVITDVDPGNVPHWEIVVAGRPQDVGMEAGVGGVSPFNCGTINNSIVFTFAVVYGTAYRDICETAAQEIAHSFGLDHEYRCQDPMTYLTGCGNKSFQNVAAPCGEYSARACMCGNTSTQNSVALLDQRLGLYEAPAVDAGVDAPMAVIDAPMAVIDAANPPAPDAGVPQDPDAATPNPGDPDAAAPNPGDLDAGTGPGGAPDLSGGCGCASSNSSGATPHVLLLGLTVLAGVCRRRRRPLAQSQSRD